jgi:putative hydrolase of the HAD superfamily
MAYDAVLLDLYDTVVWSEWSSWQHMLAERLGISDRIVGRALDATRQARSVGTYGDAAGDIAAIVRATGVDPSPAVIDDLLRLERETMIDGGVHLYDESVDVVRRLRDDGVPTVLVSNCSHNTRPIVAGLGLDELFDEVVLSFEVGASKPSAEIYRIALERVGGPDPRRSVFVDDQLIYCEGAAAIGLQTFLIVRPRTSPEGVARTNGYPTIADLHALLGGGST